MNTQEIEHLLLKYEQGETSLEEENILRSYFTRRDIPEHLKVYAELFGFYLQASNEKLPDPDFDAKLLEKLGNSQTTKSRSVNTRTLYTYIAVAASIVVLIGLFFMFGNQSKNTGTYDDPQIAYAQTKKILLNVSGNLNTGMKELSNMKTLNTGMKELNTIETFDEGMHQFEKISVLDKSKQIITQ